MTDHKTPEQGLDDRLKAAVASFSAMNPVDQALMLDDQRRSMVRSGCGVDPGPSVLADEVRRLRAALPQPPADEREALAALAHDTMCPALRGEFAITTSPHKAYCRRFADAILAAGFRRIAAPPADEGLRDDHPTRSHAAQAASGEDGDEIGRRCTIELRQLETAARKVDPEAWCSSNSQGGAFDLLYRRFAARRAAADERTPILPARAEGPAVPEGWVLVPKEPTEAMLEAAYDYATTCVGPLYGCPDEDRIWSTMLSAAPSPTAGE